MMTTEAQHFQALKKESHKNKIKLNVIIQNAYRYYYCNTCFKQDNFLFSFYIVNHLEQWNSEFIISNHNII